MYERLSHIFAFRYFVLASLPFVFASTGCQQPSGPRVADLEPYVGGRPAPMRPVDRPAPPPLKRYAAGADNGWTPPGGFSKRWQCVVVHHSASDKSTPEGMRDYHVRQRGWDDLGYHFVIGNGVKYPDGQIFVGNRWRQQKHGAHCKTPNNHYNEHGIGICLIGDFDSHPPTQKQLASLARLSSFLTAKCGIPDSKILTHGGVTHKTACPGRYFSLGPVLRIMSARAEAADPDLEANYVAP